jgi:hypothetical protein
MEKGAPLVGGHAKACLIDGKERAPVDQGAPKGKWHYWELTD